MFGGEGLHCVNEIAYRALFARRPCGQFGAMMDTPTIRETRISGVTPARWVAVAVVTALFNSACLSATYEVPRDEVERLVALDPAKRGEHVRAVQRFTTAADIIPAAPWGQPGAIAGEGAPVGAGPGMSPLYHAWRPNYYGFGVPYYGPSLWLGPSSSPSGGGLAGGSGPSSGIAAASKSGLGAAFGKADRDSARATAVAIIVAAIVIGAALAASEGARYDGAVAVHPHHPVHLLGADGDRTIALDELRLGDVGPDDKVVIAGHEGAGMWLRGRAPLDRAGLTYAVGGGFQGLQLRKGAQVSGGTFDMGIGAFATPWLGILGKASFINGAQGGGDFIGMRTGAEVQAIPLALGRLHLGAYSGVGYEWAKGSGGDLPFTDDKRISVSAGGVLELEWTTRLAMYVRYGVTSALAGAERSDWLTGLSIGLAVY